MGEAQQLLHAGHSPRQLEQEALLHLDLFEYPRRVRVRPIDPNTFNFRIETATDQVWNFRVSVAGGDSTPWSVQDYEFRGTSGVDALTHSQPSPTLLNGATQLSLEAHDHLTKYLASDPFLEDVIRLANLEGYVSANLLRTMADVNLPAVALSPPSPGFPAEMRQARWAYERLAFSYGLLAEYAAAVATLDAPDSGELEKHEALRWMAASGLDEFTRKTLRERLPGWSGRLNQDADNALAAIASSPISWEQLQAMIALASVPADNGDGSLDRLTQLAATPLLVAGWVGPDGRFDYQRDVVERRNQELAKLEQATASASPFAPTSPFSPVSPRPSGARP